MLHDLAKIIEDAVRAGAAYGDKRGRPGPHTETFEDGLLKVIDRVRERYMVQPAPGMEYVHRNG
ncbi:MAG: hypothetical protein UY48_C0003G0013 [Candidatus Gottesmanbacteria bacterium GW2011_GWB1_49_7]|uniref:Uncharacterized protein n=1 Tax=Candidatus Gottesmanbacteria bacterium GW2011_GWB1_49_7 TaxID=1618448 RepID=A0A0G1W368_9BACT|nr:MAG: hypothetical protein UY48_C0003G0013 [Candidatus Gottesmanbacteria bacterium GW2011_GWB1_49_7]